MEQTRFRHGALAMILATLAVACGGSPTSPTDSGGGTGRVPTVTAVTLAGSLALTEGGTSQLSATAAKSDGTTENVSSQATWQSSDTTVATVSVTGLVTALKTGTADISAVFASQTGRRTLQVSAARFELTLSTQAFTALSTCDDFTQGLPEGEFAVRVIAIRPGGIQDELEATRGYPGNTSDPETLAMAAGETRTLDRNWNYVLTGAAGQSLRVQFNATEWDRQLVIFPPSIRNVHDTRLSDASTSRAHSYENGTFTGLGPNTLTLGNAECGIRLTYSVTVRRL